MFTNIRRKPKAVRQQYAFWYAAGVTSVLAFIWFISLQHRLDAPVEVAEVVEESRRGAFAQFVSDAKSNFANVISANSLKVERVSAPETETVGTASSLTADEEPAETQEARTRSMNTRTPFSLSASIASSTAPAEEKATSTAEARNVRVMPRSAATGSANVR